MISAKVVADSKNEFGNRITTFVLTYPRIIHSELMTHRMFSRNAASSRAVPASKLIHAVETDPFIPLAFQKNHSGMQGTEYITDPNEIEFEIQDWLDDRDYAVKKAKARLERGVTKQLVNRPLEPFQYYTTILTATEFENFFALRCPQYDTGCLNEDGSRAYVRSKKEIIEMYGTPEENYTYFSSIDWLKLNKGQAEIHMMALAEAMWDAYNESTPKELKAGEWHIPFGDKIDFEQVASEFLNNPFIPGTEGNDPVFDLKELEKIRVKISTVMAARTSYTVVGEDQKPMTYQKMIELHDKMAAANPKHMSPFEHCAKVLTKEEYKNGIRVQGIDSTYNGIWSGNFRGFIQYRKTFENENITK